MAIKLITGLKTAADIESQDDGARIYGTISSSDRILDVGNKWAYQTISNNLVRIKDGELIMQGRHVRQSPSTYTDLTINNGTQNKKRNDIIVARYTKNSSTSIENVELAVLEGTPGTTATDPTITTGDILEGCALHEMALYRVSLDGLNIDSVTALFTELSNLENHIQSISTGGTGATTATTALSNLHGVEQTSADITYYINASTGSDTNAGSSSYPFKTIQHAINVLPKCINHDVKIYLATGTYAEVVTIKGFFGGGSFSLYGNTSSALSTSYTITGQIHIENCHMKLFLNGLNVSTTTTRAIETYTSNFVQVYYCTVAGAADVGIGFLAGSRGEIFVCSSSSKLYMYSVTGGSFVRIRGSNLGSGNTYGVKSGDGSLVMLIDLIGASVATTAYLLDSGGSIIAGGKYIS
ncbi:MAG: hypothetical protein RUMPE_01334 [Eubacteriales bacterium SKADARSKE-1]|nr:hypothetical protein [Eubacteriales bacterium SKADARSKE-1]